jgi:hypothetical protein
MFKFEKIKNSIKNNSEALKDFVKNNAKALFFVVSLSGSVQQMTAQQVVKRITDNTNETIVEFFVIRNNTSLPNTTGESNFDTGASDNASNVIVYNPAFSNTYQDNLLPAGTTPKTAEQVGNGMFNFTSNQTNLNNTQNFIAN